MSLQARQAALSSTVARQLVQNNENEAQTAAQVQEIYAQVQRQVYWFLAAALAAIGATSLYLIHANRQLFARLAALSDERRGLAQALITTREDTLREISRELHDEFGQVLTAIGSMLKRAARHTDEGSPLRADLREVGEVAQTALDSVRGLSQTLHPVDPRRTGPGQHRGLVSHDGRAPARAAGHLREAGRRPCRSIPASPSTSTGCCRRR